MNRTAKLWVTGLLVLAGAGLVSAGDAEVSFPSLITGVDELLEYPEPSAAPAGELYVIVLPGTERAVLLRPITEEEFGSYQVQAIAPEMIAHQLLAASFVVPVIAEQDVPALPIDLARFLKEAVNRISRFAVFGDVAPPTP